MYTYVYIYVYYIYYIHMYIYTHICIYTIYICIYIYTIIYVYMLSLNLAESSGNIQDKTSLFTPARSSDIFSRDLQGSEMVFKVAESCTIYTLDYTRCWASIPKLGYPATNSCLASCIPNKENQSSCLAHLQLHQKHT